MALAQSNLIAAPAISGTEKVFVVAIGVVAIAALVFCIGLVKEVLKADQGTPKMREIARAVQEGAAAYLNRQFRTLAVFSVIVFVLLILLPVNEGGWSVRIGRAVFFLVGASFSATVGYIGMTMATRANVRVAAAARNGGAARGFHIAFRTGGICGMLTVGLGLFGASFVLLVYNQNAPTVLEGFGFGGALLAMFMRVGGGIFTKAADVGADLVGKVEAGIPEDDPAQCCHDRRQRRRQRGRLCGHGGRPVRVLRRDPGGRAHSWPDGIRGQRPAASVDHRRRSA